MTCKVTVQKNTLAESLAIIGRAVGNHANLPILANVLLKKDEGQLRLSATDLTVGITVWMDATMDGDLELTLPARTLTDMVNALTEPEVVFSVDGKPEASLKNGSYKGIVKGIAASEFPTIPDFNSSDGIILDARVFREMIQHVAFAASVDDSRPVLNGVLLSIDGTAISMVATDGFRLALYCTTLPEPLGKRQLILPASALKEAGRVLNATRATRVTLILPPTGSQAVLRTENVQIVLQLIAGRYPDYQAILPKSFKTKTILKTAELLKSCHQASVIAREGSNVVHCHLQPATEITPETEAGPTGKLLLTAISDETGTSEIELPASVEGPGLEIAFNVKFVQDGLEAIPSRDVVIESNAHNTPSVIHPVDKEEFFYLLMPMHIDGR